MKPDALKQYLYFRIQLTQEKDRLERRLSEIERALGGEIPTPFRAQRTASEKPKKRSGVRAARTAKQQQAPQLRKKRRALGQLKAQIVRALKAAGKEGVAVKDLAQKIGARYNNISIWFLRGGKKLKAIKKVGPARYAWVGE